MQVRPESYEAVKGWNEHEGEADGPSHTENHPCIIGDIASVSEGQSILALDENENEIYEVKYYKGQALTAVCIHFVHFFLGPLGLVVLRYIYGEHLMKNMMLHWTLSYYFKVDFWIWLWVVLTCTLLITKDNVEIIWYPMFSTVLALFLRNLLISLKYGYYSKRHWNGLRTKAHSPEELAQNYLLVSWVKVPQYIVTRELLFSFQRCLVALSHETLKFVDLPETCKKTFLDADPSLQEIKNNTVPLFTISQLLVNSTTSQTKVYEAKIMLVLAIGYSVLPLALDTRILSDIPQYWLELLYAAFSTAQSVLHMSSFFVFILAGVYDFSRKKTLMAQCTALISREDQNTLYFDGFYPKLNLEDPKTIIAWYYMRSAFLDFGKRFTLRIFLYGSLILPICLVAIVMIVLMAFGWVDTVYLHVFISGVYLVTVTMLIMIYMVSAAVSLNKYFAIHRDILLSKITEFHSRQHDGRDISQPVFSMLWAVVEKLNQDETLHPVKIMGVTLDSSLYAKLAAVAGSGLAALLRVILGF